MAMRLGSDKWVITCLTFNSNRNVQKSIWKCVYCDFAATISVVTIVSIKLCWLISNQRIKLTFHISNTLLEDLLQCLWVLQLLRNLVDDALRKLPLLSRLNLSFIANP